MPHAVIADSFSQGMPAGVPMTANQLDADGGLLARDIKIVPTDAAADGVGLHSDTGMGGRASVTPWLRTH